MILECAHQSRSLMNNDIGTCRTEGIEPIKRVLTYLGQGGSKLEVFRYKFFSKKILSLPFLCKYLLKLKLKLTLKRSTFENCNV